MEDIKKLILVTSPPACGKTFVSKQLSKALKNIVYLDKDTLIPLSHQIFRVAHEEENRSSDFFEEWIRNPEYEVIEDLALEALDYANIVLINAPFTREIRDQKWMDEMMAKLEKKKADAIIANDVSSSNIGFNADNHQVTILTKEGKQIPLPECSKDALALEIWKTLVGENVIR